MARPHNPGRTKKESGSQDLRASYKRGSIFPSIIGRGPIKDMCPAKILKSWGHSSMDVFLIKLPHLVMQAWCSSSVMSFAPAQRAFTRIERNLSIVKGFSFLPSLFCLKIAGPFEVHLVIIAITSMGNPSKIIPIKEPKISMARLKNNQTFCFGEKVKEAFAPLDSFFSHEFICLCILWVRM